MKKKPKPKDLPKLIRQSESFGEFASMCHVKFKPGGRYGKQA